MTTTISAIRDRLKAVIEAATPTASPPDLWRYKPSNRLMLDEWAKASPGSGCLRAFDIRRVGDTADGQGWQPDEIQRDDEQLRISVAYPRLPDLYGESYESMEDCMRDDARQIRDICISPSTYTAVSGWSAVTGCVIHEPERDGAVWFQRITITLNYCEGQTLSYPVDGQ